MAYSGLRGENGYMCVFEEVVGDKWGLIVDCPYTPLHRSPTDQVVKGGKRFQWKLKSPSQVLIFESNQKCYFTIRKICWNISHVYAMMLIVKAIDEVYNTDKFLTGLDRESLRKVLRSPPAKSSKIMNLQFDKCQNFPQSYLDLWACSGYGQGRKRWVMGDGNWSNICAKDGTGKSAQWGNWRDFCYRRCIFQEIMCIVIFISKHLFSLFLKINSELSGHLLLNETS